MDFCSNHKLSPTVDNIGWFGNHIDTISYVVDVDDNAITMLKLSMCTTIAKLERHHERHHNG
jgi:hypothetical protein